MPEQELITKVDLTNVDEVEAMVREIAQMICAEQPDMPEPHSLEDLDSFSVVQVLLEVENATGRKLLEKMEGFTEGEQFRDLANYLVEIVVEEDTGTAGSPEAATDGEDDGEDEAAVDGVPTGESLPGDDAAGATPA